jgi:hypothetical protein
MTSARVNQFTSFSIEHRTERRGAAGARQSRSEAVQGRQRRTGPWLFEQQRPAGTAQLTHHGGGGQAVTDTIADDQRDTFVVEFDNVLPVATDL